MALIVSGLMFALLLMVISLYGYFHYAKAGKAYEELGTAREEGVRRDALEQDNRPENKVVVRLLADVGKRLPVSLEAATLARRQLVAAGFRSETALWVYNGLRLILPILFGAAAFFLLFPFIQNRILKPTSVIGAMVLGYLLPSIVLDVLLARRKNILRLALPDALDLMVVCVESGLGLDQAISTVVRELYITHPELCEELSLVSAELRTGSGREAALANLAKRTAEPEIRKLVAILIQTDRFGTSVADALRTHSEFMRIRRRQLAEERANKLGVKLVFPIFAFIFPGILVVMAGPAVLQIIKLLPTMTRH